ncbi:MAG TPA: hypothetical protein VKX39_00660 [Bryobacteraceae bacterium]|nr:hypothetical protein [Bryobacteraceae bacterium]
MKTTFSKMVWSIAALLLSSLVRADVTATVTMSDSTFLNLTTGSTSINGADIGYKSTIGIFYQGSAKGLNLGQIGASSYAALTQAALAQLSAAGNVTPIAPSTLTAGDVFAVQGNNGNFTKAMVTSSAGSSITFQYTTFGASGGSGGGSNAPTVTDIVNNSSLVPISGFTNSGISPSTLFVIHGSGMASVTTVTSLQDSTKGLPTTLNGAQVTISAGGKTWTPGLYYAEATQIAGVLPAAVPIGPATVTVSYNNATSSPVTFQVVPSAYGIDSYNGNLAVAQDALTYQLLNYTNSGKPGEIVILWGSGLGADSADSDTTYTSSPHSINTQTQVYVGGVQATNVAYVGASVYPGVHIIQFTLPSGVPNGCFVPVAVVTGGGTVSNLPTIPFMDSGGVCNDAYSGLNGNQINNLTGQSTVRSGDVFVGQDTGPGSGGPSTQNFASAFFYKVSGTSSIQDIASVSLGSCSLSQSVTSSGSTSTSTGLNAGAITVTGPSGGPVTLQSIPQLAGGYEAQLSSGAIPASGGAFTFTGSGGVDVGSFTATVNFPNPILSWTNQSAAATVTRSAGLTYQWTGGAPGTFVIVSGYSSSGTASGSYTCIFPQSAGQGAVPAYILAGLPAGNGNSMIENSTPFTSFTASGLDYGYAFGSVSVSVNTLYK